MPVLTFSLARPAPRWAARAALGGGVLLLLAGAGFAATGGLALKRGLYVDVATPCGAAPMSARSWFGGDGYVIQSPHVRCEARQIRQTGRATFTVRELCRDASMPEAAYEVINRVTVADAGQYELSNRFGRFRARWCRD